MARQELDKEKKQGAASMRNVYVRGHRNWILICHTLVVVGRWHKFNSHLSKDFLRAPKLTREKRHAYVGGTNPPPLGCVILACRLNFYLNDL